MEDIEQLIIESINSTDWPDPFETYFGRFESNYDIFEALDQLLDTLLDFLMFF